MKLLQVTRAERPLWLAALIGEDVYAYVPNTQRFHRNDGLRDDYFMERELEYDEIGVVDARRLIETELAALDEERMADALRDWRADPEPLEPQIVFAMANADLN